MAVNHDSMMKEILGAENVRILFHITIFFLRVKLKIVIG